RWSRSPSPRRTSSAWRSPTTSSRTSRRSRTSSPTSRSSDAVPPAGAAAVGGHASSSPGSAPGGPRAAGTTAHRPSRREGRSTMSNREVVVTGLGASTPLGGDVATTWSALLEGRSGITSLPEEWHEKLPVHFAGLLAEEPSEKLERHRLRRLDRTQQLALITAKEAWADAGSPEVDPLRLGTVVSSGIGGILTTLNQYDTFREK